MRRPQSSTLLDPQAARRSTHGGRCGTLTALLVPLLALFAGCPADDNQRDQPYANQSDKSNGGAALIGASACRQCHADIAEVLATHPHTSALSAVSGAAPELAIGPGVPDPPAGFEWSDIAYLIGGTARRALFVGSDGFVLTSGATGVDTQYNLAFGPNGTPAGFVPFVSDSAEPLALEFEDFSHRTTGPVEFDPGAPRNQDSRRGILGTWSEPGVQCEACHGPGGAHFRTVNREVEIHTDRIFVDSSGRQTCVGCHSRPFGSGGTTILAEGGFVRDQQQASELKASGGHAAFACTICHDPHRSLVQGETGLRNTCTVCHTDVTMGGHRGKVYRRSSDGYTEALACESCHMPYATLSAGSAGPSVVPAGRIGDVRTHIFRVSAEPDADFRAFLTDDQAAVRLDAQGRAAVTVDYVCLRCHNGGGVFVLTASRAAEIAPHVHDFPE
ncbi:MAG: hypothetical protein CHACPFDD_01755 [Phycisphaerae bacterium]|nr:hypothetical protein [Phycisphaerae bacterium]